MDWLEITVVTAPEKLEGLMGRLEELGVGGFVVNDEASVREFLDGNPVSWDYVVDGIFGRLRGKTSLQFYLEDSEEGLSLLSEYRSKLPEETFSVRHVRDEDWLNNWKQYFKPLEIGNRLLIVPEWEPVPDTGRTVLRIEPKTAFGTGAHASTRMCLEELENHSAETVLDLGCGSGIWPWLSVLERRAVCCDIAGRGRRLPGQCRPQRASLPLKFTPAIFCMETRWTRRPGTGGLMSHNIIADVIIRWRRVSGPAGARRRSPARNHRRRQDVRAALENAGL